MLFLITGDYIDAGALLPPEQTFQVIEQAVVTSFQILGQWEQEGKLKGGVHPGERDGAFVIDADSFEELDAMMNSLPFFGLVKWSTQPLIPFSTMAQQLPQYIQRAREMM